MQGFLVVKHIDISVLSEYPQYHIRVLIVLFLCLFTISFVDNYRCVLLVTIL